MRTYDRHLNLKEIEFDQAADCYQMDNFWEDDGLADDYLGDLYDSVISMIDLVAEDDRYVMPNDFFESLSEPVIELTEADVLPELCSCHLCKRRLN